MSKKNNILFLIALILIFSSIIFYTCLYIPDKNEKMFKSKIELSVQKMMFKIKDKKDDYLLVKFPDKKKIVSINGIINTKENYDEFENGYIIMYDANTIAFKLTDGKNCAYKEFNKAGTITMNKKCDNFNIEYKKEEKN